MVCFLTSATLSMWSLYTFLGDVRPSYSGISLTLNSAAKLRRNFVTTKFFNTFFTLAALSSGLAYCIA